MALSHIASVKAGDIRIGNRRPTDPDRVKALAESIKELGLLQAIGIDEEYNLIWGGHRLEALKLLGYTVLSVPADCKIVAMKKIEAEIAEIDENLMRAELSEVDRVQAIARRKELYEELHPDTKNGACGGGKGGKGGRGRLRTTDLSFSVETAKRTGQSKRSVERAAAIGKRLDAEAADAIRSVPAVADNKTQLKALADLTPEEQRKVAEAIKEGKAKTVTEIVPPKPKAKKSGEQRMDPRAFQKVESHLGAALRMLCALDDLCPGGEHFKKATEQQKSVMETLDAWRDAVR